MFDQQQPSSHGHGPHIVEFLGWLIVGAGAASAEVFFHRRFGSRYLGTQAFAVLLIAPFFNASWPEQDPTPLMMFVSCYFFMVVFARFGCWYRQWKGDVEHSYYNGWPRMLKPTAYRSEYYVKQFIEPGFVLFAAILTAEWNLPLSAYLLYVTFCLAAKTASMFQRSSEEAMDLNDAMLEQRQRSQQLRELRGEG